MLAHIALGKVVSIHRPGSLGSEPTIGKLVQVVEEGGEYNPAYQSRLGPETFIEEDRVRLVYTVSNRDDAVESMQAHLQKLLIKVFNSKTSALTDSYPKDEVSSWPQQVVEASAYIVNSNASMPLLSRVATGRGMQKDELVFRVLAKADIFSNFLGDLLGRKQLLEDLIGAEGVTLDELIYIESEEINTGW